MDFQTCFAWILGFPDLGMTCRVGFFFDTRPCGMESVKMGGIASRTMHLLISLILIGQFGLVIQIDQNCLHVVVIAVVEQDPDVPFLCKSITLKTRCWLVS